MPGVKLPAAGGYPRGAERARWHLREGMAVFERHFGHRPRGCWLSEGGLSDAALGLLDEQGLRWTAGGECVLDNSLARARDAGVTLTPPAAHRAFAVDGRAVRCFFRSDRLSDLIGFNYADWHADDAVANLVGELQRLAETLPEGPWLYPEDQIADLPLRMIAAEITREKLTLRLHQELPYQMTTETDTWEERKDGSVRIDQIIYVVRDGHKGIVLGNKGETIKAVGKAARLELEELLDRKVHLFLQVKVRPGWLDEAARYSAIGLDFNDGKA